MHYNDIVTTVNAQGKAEADYDEAHFALTVSVDGKTGKKAKEKLRERVAKLDRLWDVLHGEGVAENRRSNVSVYPRYEIKKNKRRFAGYTAKYAMSFLTNELDNVSRIHDMLTNMDDLQVDEPTFAIKHDELLHKAALESAHKQCKIRFENECAILGKSADQFEIGSWYVDYSNNMQSVYALVDTVVTGSSVSVYANPDPIEIHSGKSEVTCQLRLNYVPKR